MKRMVCGILLLLFVFGLASSAFGYELRGSKVYDADYVTTAVGGDLGASEGSSYKVTLYWKVDIIEAYEKVLGDTKVTIRRTNGSEALANAPVVKTVSLAEMEKGDGIRMEWSDPDIHSKTMYYRISTGTVAGARIAELIVRTPAEQEEKDGEGEEDGAIDGYYDNLTWAERLAASLVAALPNWLVEKLGLYDPIELVYMVDVGMQRAVDLPPQSDPPYWHIFSEDEMNALSTFYDGLQSFVPIWLVVAVVLVALGILYNAANPDSKVGLREYLVGFALGMLLLKFGAQLLTFVFEVNYALVKQFQSIAEPFFSMGPDSRVFSFIEMIVLADEKVSLGDAIIALVSALCIGVINFQYIMRKINVALLVGLIPIVGVIAITPAKRYTLGIWLKELISNIFLQTAHAAVLAFLLLIINASSNNPQSFWVQLVALMGLAGMAGLVRSVIGAETLGSGMAGKAGAMFGLAGLMSIGRMLGKGGGGKGGPPGLPGGGGIAAGVARGGMITAGALAGGMVTGAAMGDPSMGIGLGGAAGAKGSDVATGLVSDSPHEGARKASVDVFGRNAMTNRGILNAPTARQAQAYVANANEHLVSAKASLDSFTPTYQDSRARKTEMENLYGPKAMHLQNLQNQELPQVEQQLHAAEQGYLDVLNMPESERGANYDQTLQAAEYEYHQMQANADLITDEIEYGPQAYQDAIEIHQTNEAEYARRQQAVAQAEQRLTQESLARQFTRIKEVQAGASRGGVNSPQW